MYWEHGLVLAGPAYLLYLGIRTILDKEGFAAPGHASTIYLLWQPRHPVATERDLRSNEPGTQ